MPTKVRVEKDTQVAYQEKLYGPGDTIDVDDGDKGEVEVWLRHGWVKEVGGKKSA